MSVGADGGLPPLLRRGQVRVGAGLHPQRRRGGAVGARRASWASRPRRTRWADRAGFALRSGFTLRPPFPLRSARATLTRRSRAPIRTVDTVDTVHTGRAGRAHRAATTGRATRTLRARVATLTPVNLHHAFRAGHRTRAHTLPFRLRVQGRVVLRELGDRGLPGVRFLTEVVDGVRHPRPTTHHEDGDGGDDHRETHLQR